MERYTYFEAGKWRLRAGDTEYAGLWVDRLAAYEDTGLEPEEIVRLKSDVEDVKKSVDELWKGQRYLQHLERNGIDPHVGTDWMCGVFDILHDDKNNELMPLSRLRELAEADREEAKKNG